MVKLYGMRAHSKANAQSIEYCYNRLKSGIALTSPFAFSMSFRDGLVKNRLSNVGNVGEANYRRRF